MSTISAGTTSGTALVSTGNTDGTLQLQVNGTTPSITLATTGAIGVGSTPSYGTAGQLLVSAGTAAAPAWTTVSSSPTIVRSARTSNTILGTADQGKLIEATANSYTQTITAAATLGDGWWCYVSNVGTGFITIDPNASETITVNGVAQTTWILWPNEMGVLVCNGSNFFYYVFHKGEITQTVSSAVASVSFATGLAYRRRMSLSVDNLGFSSSGAGAVQFQINSATPGSSNLTGGYLRNSGGTFGGNSATSMTLSAGFGPTAPVTANDALFANIQVNAGPAGVFASGMARLMNTVPSAVALTTMGAWDDLTESSISTISMFLSSANIVSGTFTLREL